MDRPFSNRYEKLILDKSLVLFLPAELRQSIWGILEQFNVAFEIPGTGLNSWIEVSDIFAATVDQLEALYLQHPWSLGDNGERVFDDLEALVMGGHPACAFDFIECFYACLDESRKLDFQKAANQAFEKERCSWRLTDGKLFRIVSPLANTHATPEQGSGEEIYRAALERIQQAQQDLQSGDYASAINNTCESFEGFVNQIVAHQPSPYNPATNSFDQDSSSELACAVARQFLNSFSSLGSGNGQPTGLDNVSREYAELAVNLASSFMFFTSRLFHSESSGTPSEVSEQFEQRRAG